MATVRRSATRMLMNPPLREAHSHVGLVALPCETARDKRRRFVLLRRRAKYVEREGLVERERVRNLDAVERRRRRYSRQPPDLLQLRGLRVDEELIALADAE